MYYIDYELGHPRDVSVLPSTSVSAEPTTTLGEIAAIAAESLGGTGSLAFVSFPDHDGRRAVTHGPTAVVETDGGLRWVAYRQETITLDELRRSRAEGLFDAAPGAIAIDARPIGNGGLVPWRELEELTESLGGSATVALALRGIAAILIEDLRRLVGIVRLTRRRVRARREAIWLRAFLQQRKNTLLDAGAASPSPILYFVLRRREWDSARLALYLRVTEAEARRFLECFGYDLSPWSATYVISHDQQRLHLRREVVHALLNGLDPLDFELPDADLEDEAGGGDLRT